MMQVFVSAMETPSQFWIQVVGPGTTSLDDLIAEMNAYYNVEENAELHALKNVSTPIRVDSNSDLEKFCEILIFYR